MRAALACLLLAMTTPVSALAQPVNPKPYAMPRSEVRDMTSKSGAKYQIFIAWPEAPPPPGGYPILYLLDGNTSFPIYAEIANRWGIYWGLEPGIIVGIGYPEKTRRFFDYSPVAESGVPAVQESGPYGGASAFLTYLGDEVIPAIEADYRVDRTRRTLSGYSLGGLMVLQTLFKRPELFRTYVAGSPSIWFGDKAVLGAFPAFETRMRRGDLKNELLLSVGQYEQSPPPDKEQDPEWIKGAELSRAARMVDNARALSVAIEPLRASGLSSDFTVWPNENHATGLYPGVRQTLLNAFRKKP
jgi:predicted alpha/beta superfamily hydrolase